MTPSDLVGAAAVAAGTALLAVPAAIWLARRLDVQDRPGGYKQHEGVVPLLGGLAVVAGTLAGISLGLGAVTGRGRSGLLAIAVGAGVVLVAGLLDDARGLSARRKLVWQISAAAAAGGCLAALDVRLDLFLSDAMVTVLLTVLWVVAVTNAMNLIDHANGLCAGLAALAAAALAAINFRSGAGEVALAAAALAGACCGFLPWNWPRARIFLGDAGSMTLGFALAGLAVLGVYTPESRAPHLAIAAPTVALSVPLLDAAVVVALRLRDGQPPWRADRRHVAHRLARRGLRPMAAVAAVWAAAAAAAAAAWALPVLTPLGALLLLAGLSGVLVGLFLAAGARGLPPA
jgi:UDP-GlcNAc:undecaprenyl-phosphate/decaprenyl-phosphate GlcNAc-1-phosphate transferase